MSSQTLIRKVLAALFLGFVLLFIVRFLLGYFIEFDDGKDENISSASRLPILNIASMSYEKAVANNLRQIWDFERPPNPMEANILAQLEVYAKEATINTYSSEFDSEEAQVKEIIKNLDIKVRIENTKGLEPNRQLQLVLKVPEERFEQAVEALKKVGNLDTFRVTKEDKSEEARNLIAQRKSLEAYKASLVSLREQPGKVEEYIKLEEKIQEIERQIQSLGVQLGDYIQDVSYSNISFALVERIEFLVDSKESPTMARIVNALIWTVKWYFIFVMAMAFIGLCLASIRTLKAKDNNTPPPLS